jgi:hypothetical protein
MKLLTWRRLVEDGFEIVGEIDSLDWIGRELGFPILRKCFVQTLKIGAEIVCLCFGQLGDGYPVVPWLQCQPTKESFCTCIMIDDPIARELDYATCDGPPTLRQQAALTVC